MAPVQARGESRHVGPACVVYALGAVLYECLTGRPPFRAATVTDTLLQVINDEPVAPSRLAANCPPDLEAVCLKCLEKQPARRYASAEELADDLGRFLHGEPTVARPLGPARRAWRWCRRNSVVAGLLATLVLVLAGGLGAVTWQWQETVAEKRAKERQREEADDARHDAEEAWREEARRAREEEKAKKRAQKAEADALAALEREQEARYLQDVTLADLEWNRDYPKRALELLEGCQERRRGWEWNYQKRRAHRERLRLVGHTGPVNAVLFARGRLLTASEDHTVRVWEVKTGKEQLVFREHKAGVTAVVVHPDGTRAASTDRDGRVLVWDVVTGKKVWQLKHGDVAFGLAFSKDGKSLYTAGSATGAKANAEVLIWDVESRKKARALDTGHCEAPYHLVVSPDGKRLATISLRDVLSLWDVDTGKKLVTHTGDIPRFHHALAFSPDSRYLAWGSVDGRFFVWDMKCPIKDQVLLGWQDGKVDALAFTHGGQYLATAGWTGAIHLRPWRTTLESLRRGTYLNLLPNITWETPVLRGHMHWVNALAASDEGEWLASGGQDGDVRIWAIATGDTYAELPVSTSGIHALAPSRDGRLLAYSDSTGYDPDRDKHKVVVLDLARNKAALTINLPTLAGALAFHPSGRALAVALKDMRTITLVDVPAGTVRYLDGHARAVQALGFSPDGKWLASGGGARGLASGGGARRHLPGEVFLWDASDWKRPPRQLEGNSDSVLCLAFRADGRALATAGLDRRIRLWETPSGRPLAVLPCEAELVTDLAFRPDGRELAACADDRLLLWDLSNGLEKAKKRRQIAASSGPLRSLAYTKDGRRIATCGTSSAGLIHSEARLWDAATGQMLLDLREVMRTKHVARFSHDGNRLYLAGFGRINVLDGAPLP
jgi:WD40 repeat protein